MPCSRSPSPEVIDRKTPPASQSVDVDQLLKSGTEVVKQRLAAARRRRQTDEIQAQPNPTPPPPKKPGAQRELFKWGFKEEEEHPSTTVVKLEDGLVPALLGAQSLGHAANIVVNIVRGNQTVDSRTQKVSTKNTQKTKYLQYLNPVKYIPGINCLGPAAKTTTEIFKTWVVPASERVQREMNTFGWPTGLFFSFLLICSLVYSYVITAIKNWVYMWVLKGITVSLAAILSTKVFHFKSRYVCLTILIVSLIVHGMKDDTFIDSHLKDRMNNHFYQEVEARAAMHDPDLSVLSPLFAGRKVLETCSKRNNIQTTCEEDLKEFARIHGIMFDAVKKVLDTPEITTPRDVTLQLKLGNNQFLGSTSKIIEFRKTLDMRPPSKTEVVERDYYESDVYALAAARLMDGKYYYEKYGQWLKTQQTTYGILDNMQWAASFTGLFEMMLFGPTGGMKFARVKLWLTSIKWVFQWLFPNQVTVENFQKFFEADATVYRKDNVLDYCIPGRCINGNAHVSVIMHSILNSTTEPYVQQCPLAYMKEEFNFQECPALQEHCLKAIEKYSNPLNPTCPTHCRRTIFLEDFQNKKRDGDFVKKGGYTCVHTDDPESAKILEKQCESTWCQMEKTAKGILDTVIPFWGGGLTFMYGTYMTARRRV